MVSKISSRIDTADQPHCSTKSRQIGIWEWDLVSDSVYCSADWKKFHQCGALRTPDQVTQFVHPDDREKREKLLARLRAGELEQLECEYRVKKFDGSWATVVNRIYAIRNDAGKPVRLVSCEFEVSSNDHNRPSAEKDLLKLRELNERLHKVLESSSIGIWEWFFEDERLVWDEKMHEIYGVDVADFRGVYDDWSDRLHPDDLERISAENQCRDESNQQIAAEFRIVRPNGKVRHIYSNAYTELDKHGNPARTIGVNVDITERREAEFALLESENKLQRIADHLPGMVYRFVLDSDGNIGWSYLSSQARQLFGIEPSDLIVDADLLWQLIVPEDLDRLKEKMHLSAKEFSGFFDEFRTTSSDKGTRWFQVNSQPQKAEDGDEIFWDGVVLEITDRKEAELANNVLAKATRIKDEFLANMSHELRTPLTAIIALTDGLQQGMFGETTPKQVECLKIVEQSSVHLLDLINEILDLAKIESGQSELNLSFVQVSELCKSCLNLVAPQAKQKRIELSMKAPSDLPMLCADEKRIRQVLINLLSNAVKFTPQGGKVKLEAETLSTNTTGLASQTLRFSVSDTGIGIKADQLETTFDPFVQLDSSLTRQHGGTGLGLSLVKQLVELHSGKVGVSSEIDRGSCFTVDIPIELRSCTEKSTAPEVAESIGEAESPDPALQTDPASDQPLILLVEDNDLVANSIVPMLEFSKFRVLRAANGKIAVEMTIEHRPDLILMDIQMPVMDGFEATRQIRAIAKFSQLPIIAVSGFAKLEDSQRCIDAGMNLFMAKPLRIKELVGNINSMVKDPNINSIQTTGSAHRYN